nr:kinesin-like protein KIF25 isoform X9 [Pan paniscus]
MVGCFEKVMLLRSLADGRRSLRQAKEDKIAELETENAVLLLKLAQETVLVKCDRPGHPLINKTYHFERVYGPAESQSAVFGDVCPLLTSLLDGYNVCVMAYGQTGSGKSYTMLGRHSDDGPVLPLDPQSDLGIIPRVAEELFRLISENTSRSPKVEVFIVEVYNNDIFDLLAKDSIAAVSGVKREVMTAKDGWTEVALLASEAVGSASKRMELVHGGLQLRAKHPTLVHVDSSRSHLIITVTLTTASCSDGTAGSWEPRRACGAGAGSTTARGLGRQRVHWCVWSDRVCPEGDGVHQPQPCGPGRRPGGFVGAPQPCPVPEQQAHPPPSGLPRQRHLAQTLQGLGFGIRARQVQQGPARKKPLSSQAEGKRRPD